MNNILIEEPETTYFLTSQSTQRTNLISNDNNSYELSNSQTNNESDHEENSNQNYNDNFYLNENNVNSTNEHEEESSILNANTISSSNLNEEQQNVSISINASSQNLSLVQLDDTPDYVNTSNDPIPFSINESNTRVENNDVEEDVEHVSLRGALSTTNTNEEVVLDHDKSSFIDLTKDDDILIVNHVQSTVNNANAISINNINVHNRNNNNNNNSTSSGRVNRIATARKHTTTFSSVNRPIGSTRTNNIDDSTQISTSSNLEADDNDCLEVIHESRSSASISSVRNNLRNRRKNNNINPVNSTILVLDDDIDNQSNDPEPSTSSINPVTDHLLQHRIETIDSIIQSSSSPPKRARLDNNYNINVPNIAPTPSNSTLSTSITNDERFKALYNGFRSYATSLENSSSFSSSVNNTASVAASTSNYIIIPVNGHNSHHNYSANHQLLNNKPSITDISKTCLTSSNSSSSNSSSLSCPICLESFDEIKAQNKRIMATFCGHVFCNTCLDEHWKKSSETSRSTICPTCRTKLNKNKVHGLYF